MSKLQSLRDIALKRAQVVDQARDRLGRWTSENKGLIATKAAGAAGGFIGAAVAGPVGAAAGNLIGAAAARSAIAVNRATKGEVKLSGNETQLVQGLFTAGEDLQQTADIAHKALAKVDTDDLEDVLSKDMIGWAVAHAANYGLLLIPGADFLDLIPGKGAAVAAATTGTLYKLKKAIKNGKISSPTSTRRIAAKA